MPACLGRGCGRCSTAAPATNERRPGSSAEADTHGNPEAAITCRTRVVLPTCLGPVTTWMNLLGSRSPEASDAAKGRTNTAALVPILLIIVSNCKYSVNPHLRPLVGGRVDVGAGHTGRGAVECGRGRSDFRETC